MILKPTGYGAVTDTEVGKVGSGPGFLGDGSSIQFGKV